MGRLPAETGGRPATPEMVKAGKATGLDFGLEKNFSLTHSAALYTPPFRVGYKAPLRVNPSTLRPSGRRVEGLTFIFFLVL
jgi:hypothetical protein